MLNTSIYHHLSPTCFGVCYTKELVDFEQVWYPWRWWNEYRNV